MKKVQFCENNFSHGTEDLVDKLRKENIDVEVEPCLGYCGECAVGPMALVDDELILEDSPEELYKSIKEE